MDKIFENFRKLISGPFLRLLGPSWKVNLFPKSGSVTFPPLFLTSCKKLEKTDAPTLREKCPNTEFFLVCIFPHSDWIRTRKNSVFGHFWSSAMPLGITLRTDGRADEQSKIHRKIPMANMFNKLLSPETSL